MKINCTMDEWLAYGPRLVAMSRIAKVTIEGKHPNKKRYDDMPHDVYEWRSDCGDGRSEDLPPEIIHPWLAKGDVIHSDTVKSATEWLSKACIHWAKSKQKPAVDLSTHAKWIVTSPFDAF